MRARWARLPAYCRDLAHIRAEARARLERVTKEALDISTLRGRGGAARLAFVSYSNAEEDPLTLLCPKSPGITPWTWRVRQARRGRRRPKRRLRCWADAGE